jgi:hypothetical protein
MKHWVKNKSRGEYVHVMMLIALFDWCLTNSLASPLAYQLRWPFRMASACW